MLEQFNLGLMQSELTPNQRFNEAYKNSDKKQASEFLSLVDVEQLTTAEKKWALIVCAESNNIVVLKKLLDSKEVLDEITFENNFVLIAAIGNNHLEFVEALLKVEAVKLTIADNDNKAISAAARCGNLDILNRLLKEKSVLDNITIDNNDILSWAAYFGHLPIVERLLEIDDVRAKIANRNNRTLLEAAKNGRLSTVNLLLQNKEVVADLAINNNQIIEITTIYDQPEIVNRLLDFQAVQDNAAFNNNLLLKWAISHGQLALVKRLLTIPAVMKAMVEEKHELFTLAQKHNNVKNNENSTEILNYLLAIPEMQPYAAYDGNALLMHAAKTGNLSLLGSLLVIPQVLKDVTINENQALKYAQMYNHPEIIKRLNEISAVAQYSLKQRFIKSIRWFLTGPPEEALQLCTLIDPQSLDNAECGIVMNFIIKYGSAKELEHFLSAENFYQIVIDDRKKILSAYDIKPDIITRLLDINEFAEIASIENNILLCFAIRKGHMDLLNKLMMIPNVIQNIPPFSEHPEHPLYLARNNNRPEMISLLLDIEKIRNSSSLTTLTELLLWSIREGHLAVLNKLLTNDSIREYVIGNVYGVFSSGTVNQRPEILLRLLEISDVRNSTDLASNENYFLRRAAEYGYLDVVNQLLTNPAVLQDVTAWNNGALRRAQENNHQLIVDRLNEIPAVRDYVDPITLMMAAFRQSNRSATLADIAQNTESAMLSLSATEEAAIQYIKTQYANKYKEKGGQSKILDEMLNYFKECYLKDPIQYANKALPIEYIKGLSEDIQQLYYNNIFHGALRYFLDPNPWLHPRANYVVRHGDGSGHADIKEDHKELIAYLWLACDNAKNSDMPDGYSKESLKQLLAVALSGMNRGHNWDNDRPIVTMKNGSQVQTTEQFDDGEQDKPTCQYGAKKPLATLLDLLFKPTKPEERRLDQQIIINKFENAFINSQAEKPGFNDYIFKLDVDQLSLLKNALEEFSCVIGDLSELTHEQIKALKVLEIDGTSIKEFVEQCRIEFGTDRISKTKFTGKDLITHYASYEEYITTELAKKWFTLELGTNFLENINIRLQQLTPLKDHKEELEGKGIREQKEIKENAEIRETPIENPAPVIFSKPKKKRKELGDEVFSESNKKQRQSARNETLEGSFVNNDGHRRSRRLVKINGK